MAHNHEEILCKVKTEMPGDELLCDLADLFKIFGDTTRMKILYSLFESELCVCAIAELLGMTQSAISHQLKVLIAERSICLPPIFLPAMLLSARIALCFALFAIMPCELPR